MDLPDGLPSIKIDHAPNPDVISKWKRSERRLTVVALPKVLSAKRKRLEEEERKREKRLNFTKIVESLPKITAQILTTTDDYYFPPPEIPIDQEIAEFETFASNHKEYELARQYYYGLNTFIGYRTHLRNQLRQRRDDLVNATTPLELLYEKGKKPTYRTFHAKVRETMTKYCYMCFELCEQSYQERAKLKKSGPPEAALKGVSANDLREAVAMHRRGIARVDKIIEDLKSRKLKEQQERQQSEQ